MSTEDLSPAAAPLSESSAAVVHSASGPGQAEPGSAAPESPNQEPLSAESAPAALSSPDPLVAVVRLDDQMGRLVGRLQEGEIAVIKVPDLDRASALALAACRPAAVLNAARTVTGRRAATGAGVLLDSGVPLLDDFGPDLLSLRDGDTVSVDVAAAEVSQGRSLVCAGQVVDAAPARASSGAALDSQAQALARSLSLVWESDSAALLDSEGLPNLPSLADRTAVVIGPGPEVAGQLQALRHLVKGTDPYIIVAGCGASAAAPLKRRPDLFVGDPTGIAEDALAPVPRRIIVQRPGGHQRGADWLHELGMEYDVLPTSASAVDAAVLLADAAGASSIVRVGDDPGIVGYLDQSPVEGAAGFLIRLRAGRKLISADAAQALYRPPVPTWLLVALVVAALVVFGVALLATPWGQSIGGWVPGAAAESAAWAVAAGFGLLPTVAAAEYDPVGGDPFSGLSA